MLIAAPSRGCRRRVVASFLRRRAAVAARGSRARRPRRTRRNLVGVRTRDTDDPRPHDIQVAEQLWCDIVDGTLRLGGQLPSHGEVATSWGVSVGTVKRAYDLLPDKGLIISRQGQPAHVRTRVDGGRAPTGGRSSAPDVQGAIADLERRLAEVERRRADSGR